MDVRSFMNDPQPDSTPYEEPLTGLLQLRGLDRELFRERARVVRTGERLAAALVAVDGLAQLARAEGPEVARRAQKELGARIASAVRPTDAVGHPSANEFLVLIGCTRMGEARRVGERLMAALSGAPLPFEHPSLRLGHAVAVIDLPDSLPTADAVLARARRSLAAARSPSTGGSGGADVAGGALGATTVFVARAELQSAMLEIASRAERGRSLAVQPIRDLESGAILGHEFLSRGPLGSHDSPIPLFRRASERGELEQLDLACLESCLTSAERVADLAPGGRVHVNLFPQTLAARADRVLELFASATQRGTHCVLELDEQELPCDLWTLELILRQLRDTGVQIALDHVAPHSGALEALIVLEPDFVKPDRELLRDAGRHPGRWRSLLRLGRMAEHLGTAMIAVGVEDEEQRLLAREAGSRAAQGHHLGRPRPLSS